MYSCLDVCMHVVVVEEAVVHTCTNSFIFSSPLNHRRESGLARYGWSGGSRRPGGQTDIQTNRHTDEQTLLKGLACIACYSRLLFS